MAQFSPKAEPRKVTVAATQISCSWDIEDNLVRAPWAGVEGQEQMPQVPPPAAPTRASRLLLPAYSLPAPVSWHSASCRGRPRRWCVMPRQQEPTSSFYRWVCYKHVLLVTSPFSAQPTLEVRRLLQHQRQAGMQLRYCSVCSRFWVPMRRKGQCSSLRVHVSVCGNALGSQPWTLPRGRLHLTAALSAPGHLQQPLRALWRALYPDLQLWSMFHKAANVC